MAPFQIVHPSFATLLLASVPKVMRGFVPWRADDKEFPEHGVSGTFFATLLLASVPESCGDFPESRFHRSPHKAFKQISLPSRPVPLSLVFMTLLLVEPCS
mmetsp:Transcript_23678/g.40746  ORF Transcript_23678/g.40746 Transcript_23678/m.40746 type:complete len:101 (+) Transcript_23678:838-1140(+)